MPSDKKPAGPVDHLVTVRYDAMRSVLTLEQPAVSIKPGDRVIWQFSGIPSGWSPWIEFRHPADEAGSFLGPFREISQSSSALWGVCADGATGTFLYRLSIQKGIHTGWDRGGALVVSGPGALAVDPIEKGQTQVFTVTLDDPNAVVPRLSIAPIGLIIQAGDTVEWDFAIPEGDVSWRPLVTFHRYDGAGVGVSDSLHLGPFTSLSSRDRIVRGAGNSNVRGTYYFNVSAVRIGDGGILWVGSGDPAIDNRGGVGDPTSTGGNG